MNLDLTPLLEAKKRWGMPFVEGERWRLIRGIWLNVAFARIPDAVFPDRVRGLAKYEDMCWPCGPNAAQRDTQ
jgi:hypothetical protein